MIALDTSALIWAVQSVKGKQADRSRLEAIEKMADGKIILPAPALAEYLQPVPESDRSEALRRFEKFATVVPFDYRAAMKCADLFKIPRRGKNRQAFKVDAMILATAIAQGASHFLEVDDDFKLLAKNQQINLVSVASLKVPQMLPLGPPPPSP